MRFPLPVGTYTIVAGDEWGQIVFLHFAIVSNSLKQSPIDVMSVTGPVPPYLPAGPEIKLTLRNVGNLPIISLNATLQADSPYKSNFIDVNSSSPLAPGKSMESIQIGIGFTTGSYYLLIINGILSSGLPFSITEQVSVSSPSS